MIKFGILACPQYTDWQSLHAVGQRVDELGYDSLWTWDHVYPIFGSPGGPSFEGWLTLAGWAGQTKRVTLGLMVGANTFRNPALVAKMATTLDHMSGGRAILGLGAAWFELEHRAFGFDFGSGFGERLDRLDEAAELIRGMIDGLRPSARGRYYHADSPVNNPPPMQQRLPLLIGGGGVRKTLRTVAKYADICNFSGSPAEVRRKDDVLRRWCAEVGRNEGAIERTTQGAVGVALRSTQAAADRVAERIREQNSGWDGPGFVGTPGALVERLAPYVPLGFRHFYFDIPSPYDDETLERLVAEVRPALEEVA